jgi:uncharacterized membrane protein
MRAILDKRGRLCSRAKRQRGAAAVEFALVLPILLVLLLGIIDFGLYFYNDLQLTQAARDAARYLSVDNSASAQTTISDAEARLVSATMSGWAPPAVPGHGESFTVQLEATYSFITPLPTLIPGLGSDLGINASAIMRRE